MPPTAGELSQVLADWRGDAAVLRRRGDARAAELLEKCASEMAAVADEYTSWLTESQAGLRSGKRPGQVRRLALQYLHTPHVRPEGRAYLLRACIVPRRQHLEMIREDAARGNVA